MTGRTYTSAKHRFNELTSCVYVVALMWQLAACGSHLFPQILLICCNAFIQIWSFLVFVLNRQGTGNNTNTRRLIYVEHLCSD